MRSVKTRSQSQSESTPANSGNASSSFRPFQTTWTIFWVAFLVRVLYMTLAHTYHLRTDGDHFQFGWEMGRVARALVTGYGYADPFMRPHRPHHLGSSALSVADCRSIQDFRRLHAAIRVGHSRHQQLLLCLTTLTTYEIAARCFNRRVAVWSAWVWALYPAAMQYAVRWVWEMTVSTWLLSLILVLALRMRQIGEIASDPDPLSNDAGRTLRRWVIFGALWGILALSNPSLLLFLPACGLWVLHGTRHMQRQVGFASMSAVIFIICISPWMVRNALVFHRFIPMRANFGAELYLGNGPGAMGFLMEYNHPYEAPDQLRLYKQLGEVDYAQMRGRLAKKYIEHDPGLFLRNSLKRLYFFWISVPHPSNNAWYIEAVRVANFAFASIAGLFGLALALKRRKPAAWLFAWAFLLVPLIYYFVTVHARFRDPLEPLIAILAVYLFQSAEKGWPRWIHRQNG